MRKGIKITFITLGVLVGLGLLVGGYFAYLIFASRTAITTNPKSYHTVGDIALPLGYERVLPNDTYAQYLRSIPLKEKGAKVKLQKTTKDANFQNIAYAVVDMPLLYPNEDCADVCIRLRGEYLYHTKQYNKIRFAGQYAGGSSRKAFEQYMVRAMSNSVNTSTMAKRLPIRKLEDMQPGDVFVYPARKGQKYGHAICIVDVAQHKLTGKKIFLIAEGNMPGRSIHIVRNWWDNSSPWFSLDDGRLIKLGTRCVYAVTRIPFLERYDKDCILISPFAYHEKDLRYLE